MCGAEPLVSMDSAESVDAFYKLLREGERLSTSSPANVSPRWPAARNDHYCHQKVCRHAVLDLSSLCMPSDSESDVPWHVTPGSDSFDTQYDIISTDYSETGSYSPDHSRFADEYVGKNVQFDPVDWNQRVTHPRTVHYTRASSHNARVVRNSQISPKMLDSGARALRQEIDNLHISSAESYLELEERFVSLSESYGNVSLGYGHLAEKHDRLLRITSELCTQLGVHAEALVKLNEWKMHMQKSFAEVQVQGQDPELLYCGTQYSTGQLEPDSVMADSQTSRMTMGRRDSGIADLEPPVVKPGTPPKQHVVHLRLVLRLPPRPDIEESLGPSPGDPVSDHHASSKRVRKPTEKRKAATLQAKSTGKKVKKSRT